MKKNKERDRDRVREIYKHVAIEKLPFMASGSALKGPVGESLTATPIRKIPL